MNTDTKKYKIKIVTNGQTFTYTECTLLADEDICFLRFTDKFNIEFRYNKNVIVSMEVLK